MYVEMRTYTLHPGTTPEYFRIYETMGMEAQNEILGHRIGYFHTEIGPLNQVVHMWAYESLDDRDRRRAALAADPRWQKMLPELRKCIRDQETKILVPAPFAPVAKKEG